MGTFLKSDFDKNLAKQMGYLNPAEEQDQFGLFLIRFGIIIICSVVILGSLVSICLSIKGV